MKAKGNSKTLSAGQKSELIKTLKDRFDSNMNRHQTLKWDVIQAKLESQPEKLWSLYQMEMTGGEPDVVSHDEKKGEFIFYDCSPESPKGRRSICYDRESLDSRKENKPQDSALEMAESMGIQILSETQYRTLQEHGNFDTKTSSWVITPPDIRKLGGALFADRRYGHVFIYHNGASSYYSARGFRALLKI